MDTQTHFNDVPEGYLAKWQATNNVLAKFLGVPVALIMRVHAETTEVLVSSQTPNNPYEPHETADLGTGLYCETVMKTNNMLVVPFAPDDPQWANNPDIALDMNSYMGVPLVWHDGSMFGTLCVLDKVRQAYTDVQKWLLLSFKRVIERDICQLGKKDGHSTPVLTFWSAEILSSPTFKSLVANWEGDWKGDKTYFVKELLQQHLAISGTFMADSEKPGAVEANETQVVYEE